MRTLAGGRVSSETALQIAAVFRAVRLIAGQMASLPFTLYRNKPKGGKERITDHWLYQLLARRPNRWQNAFEWRQMLQGHLELRGNAYNRIISDFRTGEITDLVPIHPDRIRVDSFDGGNGDFRYRITRSDGTEEIVPRGEIWHRRGFSWDGLLGVSVITAARESLGLSLAAQEYGSRFFANDARPTGGWIEFPGQFKDQPAKDMFRASWKAAQAGNNRGNTAVLEMGMKYHEIGMTNEDGQFLESRKFQVSEVARWFDLPPHKIGDLEKATFSNIEQQSLDFIQDCLAPRAEAWEASIEAELLPDNADLEVEFDFANLLRGDSQARSRYYHNGIADGWLTRNEARLAENLDPLDGLDEPLQPLNMTTVDPNADPAAGEPADPNEGQPADPGAEPDDVPPAPTDQARLRNLEAAIVDRIVRKEVAAVKKARERPDAAAAIVQFYDKHLDYVAEALAVSRETARAYCQHQEALAVIGREDLGVRGREHLLQLGATE
jgi:HK97 family phage portal protein